MEIATVHRFTLRLPENAWYSFHNSPYTGHRTGTAMDVYYPERALFPLEEGVVREIRKIRTPTNIPVDTDFLTIIETGNGTCLKVLHVKPAVAIGEKVCLGDEIGDQIPSGFFMPWSDRHAHYEIRDINDRYRARGAFSITPHMLKRVPVAVGAEFEVVEKTPEYYWVKPTHTGNRALTPIVHESIPIEGGMPHYRYGVIFGKVETLKLFNHTIRPAQYLNGHRTVFNTDFTLTANHKPVRGIGVYCNKKEIKLIGGTFEEGERVGIEIEREGL